MHTLLNDIILFTVPRDTNCSEMSVHYRMDQNEIYEEIQKVQPQLELEEKYTTLKKERSFENNYQDVYESPGALPKREKEKATRCKCVSIITAVASILAIGGVIIVIGLHVNTLQENTATLTRLRSHIISQLSSIQSSMNNLTTRVNSPVNLYQNCIKETRNCTKAARVDTWVTFCTTDPLPTNVTVSFVNCIFVQANSM